MIVIITVFLLNSNLIKADEEQVNVIYFYSPTCSSCYNLNEYFDYLIEKYTNLNLIKLNIADLKNKSLLDEYNKTYNVSEEDEGIIPVIFCKDTYLTGEKEIKEHLENLINRNDGLQTIIIQDISENHEADIKKFMNFTILSIFVAGLVNGLKEGKTEINKEHIPENILNMLDIKNAISKICINEKNIKIVDN